MSHRHTTEFVYVQCDTPGCFSRVGVPRKPGEHVNLGQVAATRAAEATGWRMSAFGVPPADLCPSCVEARDGAAAAPSACPAGVTARHECDDVCAVVGRSLGRKAAP